jgi:nicotinate-nucleotide pyrophosphorylase (carboxylating)
MAPKDIRDRIFAKVRRKRYCARIASQGDGILSGTQWFERASKQLGITVKRCKKAGTRIKQGERIALLKGDAKQIALAEEELIGWIAKASGIATAAWNAKRAAGKKVDVVSGAWKKMPLPIKDLVRQAILDGGLHYRISEKPFAYLDKNYVQILGGIKEALLSIKDLHRFTTIVQLKSKGGNLLQKAALAARLGAHIIMIDTGKPEDISNVDLALRERGLRKGIKIAFGGNIQIGDLKHLRKMPVDIVDIGRAIVDAPLLDMKIDVMKRV